MGKLSSLHVFQGKLWYLPRILPPANLRRLLGWPNSRKIRSPLAGSGPSIAHSGQEIDWRNGGDESEAEAQGVARPDLPHSYCTSRRSLLQGPNTAQAMRG